MNNSRKYNFFILFVDIRNFAILIKSKNIIFFRFLVFDDTANTLIPNISNSYIFLYRFLLYILGVSNLFVYFFNIKYILLALFVFFRFNIYIFNYSDVFYAMVFRIFCRRNLSSDRNRLFINIFEYR